jgi:hypothetical protein
MPTSEKQRNGRCRRGLLLRPIFPRAQSRFLGDGTALPPGVYTLEARLGGYELRKFPRRRWEGVVSGLRVQVGRETKGVVISVAKAGSAGQTPPDRSGASSPTPPGRSGQPPEPPTTE